MTDVYEYGAVPPTADELAEIEAIDFAGVRVTPGGTVVESEPAPATGPPPVPPPGWEQPPAAGPAVRSGIEALFDDLDRQLDVGPVDLPVPARAGFSCRYERLLDTRRLDPWRALSFDRDTIEGLDTTRLASLGLSQLHLGFLADGHLVLGEDGQPLTFRSPHVQTKLGVSPTDDGDDARLEAAAETVLRYYALYVHAKSAWQTLLALSGFADVITPQERPSPT